MIHWHAKNSPVCIETAYAPDNKRATRRYKFDEPVILPIHLNPGAGPADFTIGPSLDELSAVEQKSERVLADAHTLDRRTEDKLFFSLYKIPSVNTPRQPVPVNPYFIGLWLGDGCRCSTKVFNYHETEVINFLSEYADTLDMALSFQGGLETTAAVPVPRAQWTCLRCD